MDDFASLLAIGKTIFETIKTAKDVFKTESSPESPQIESSLDKLADDFVAYQKRMELLATQLYQCESLTRFIPMWLVYHDKFDRISPTPTIEEAKLLDTDLRWFIHSSITDQFSSVFFRTSYDQLPVIERMIDNFRNRIKDIDRDVSTVSFGQPQMLTILWGASLKGDLFRLRRDAMEIERTANETFENVINELRQAAANGFVAG